MSIRVAAASSLALSFSLPAAAQCDVQELGWGSSGYPGHGLAVGWDGERLAATSSWFGNAMLWRMQGGQWVVDGVVQQRGSWTNYWGVGVFVKADRVAIGHQAGDGRIHLYREIGGVWTHELDMFPPVSGHQPSDMGEAVVLLSDRLVAGAPGFNYGQGALAWIEDTGAGWTSMEYAAGAPGEEFGRSVAVVDDDTLLVGAPGVGATWSGKVYVMHRAPHPTGWTVGQVISSPDSATRNFGKFVEFDGQRALIGTEHEIGTTLQLFDWDPQTKTLAPGAPVQLAPEYSDPLYWDDLHLSGDRIAIGLPLFDNIRGRALGLVEIDGVWTLRDVYEAPNPKVFDKFGTGVWITPYGTVVGAGAFSGTQGGLIAWNVAPHVLEFCHCRTGAPCGNTDLDAGCVNATGAGARLSGCGPTSVGADSLVMRATDLVPNTFATLFMGRAEDPVPLMNGQLCLTGQLYRFPVAKAQGGTLEYTGLVADSLQFPPDAHLIAGVTWSFQLWYRDAQGPCGATSNFTNGVAVTFSQ